MTLTERILPSEEWARLADTSLGPYWPALDPRQVTVIVIERDGEIQGCCALMRAVHAEFLWIAPSARGRVAVMRRLRRRVIAEAATFGLPTLLMSACSSLMVGIIRKLGASPLPGAHFVVSLKETPCPQR